MQQPYNVNRNKVPITHERQKASEEEDGEEENHDVETVNKKRGLKRFYYFTMYTDVVLLIISILDRLIGGENALKAFLHILIGRGWIMLILGVEYYTTPSEEVNPLLKKYRNDADKLSIAFVLIKFLIWIGSFYESPPQLTLFFILVLFSIKAKKLFSFYDNHSQKAKAFFLDLKKNLMQRKKLKAEAKAQKLQDFVNQVNDNPV